MTFQKGVSGNPNGASGLVDGYQRYGDRAKYLLGLYSVEGILELMADRKKFGKLPVKDGMIIKQLAESIAGSDARLERESLLDRIEGKAAQTIDVSGQIGIVQIVLQAATQQPIAEGLEQSKAPVLEHDQTMPQKAVIENKPMYAKTENTKQTDTV